MQKKIRQLIQVFVGPDSEECCHECERKAEVGLLCLTDIAEVHRRVVKENHG